ncbi:MAG: acyl-CoA dehydrogenase family protein [Acidimicrobiales bacterium]
MRRDRRWSWGEGSDRVGVFADRTPEEEAADLAAARRWRATVFDAGFGWPSGPVSYGGRGLPARFERLWYTLQSGYETPSQTSLGVGLAMVAPTILAHGHEVARHRWLRALWRGDAVACQLFSEPGAGSDLAGVRARATPVTGGAEWVLEGQKVWTSGAHHSDIGEILCRTSDEGRHRGLTAFILEMRQPGVEVRPLRQMTGGASFNEVFLDRARVSDHHRLGEIGGGWAVAMTTLVNERLAIGASAGGPAANAMDRLMGLLAWAGKADDPVLRQRFADVYVHWAAARAHTRHQAARLTGGEAPGPELSVSRLALTANLARISDLVTEALGSRLLADTGEWGTFAWAEFILGVPGLRIAGGTDEILKTVIGERVLGLPRGPRP